MKNMYVEMSNGFTSSGGNKVVDLGYTEEEFRALPTLEQEEIVKDAVAEEMDIGVYVDHGKDIVMITVSIGYGNAGCLSKTEAAYTAAQWEKLYPEEQEEHIIECAWECMDYWEFAK